MNITPFVFINLGLKNKECEYGIMKPANLLFVYRFSYFCVLKKEKVMHKRTNIEIDLDLVKEVMAAYNLRTIKEAVNFSLEKTVESKKRANLLRMKGKVEWQGNLDEMRQA